MFGMSKIKAALRIWRIAFAAITFMAISPLSAPLVWAAETVALSEEEKAWIQQNPVIRVHNESDWPPFNFTENGIPTGYSIEFMDLVAEKTGLKVEYVTGPTWNEFLEMMKEGTLDVMLNIVKTPKRRQYLLYTRPYADNPNTIISRQENFYGSLKQLYGKTIAAPKGFFYEEILKRDFPQIKLHLVKDTLESMKAVSFRQADAALGELAVFNYLIDKHLMTGLALSGEVNLGGEEYSLLNMASRRDLPLLASILDKGIAAVTPEEKSAIGAKWIAAQYEISLVPQKVIRVALQVGGGALAIVILILLWNRRLGREIRMRKATQLKLQAAKEEADAANKAKSQFLANMSHELRTPITSIQGTLGLMAGGALGPLDKPVQEMVDIANRNCLRLRRLIDDILDVEKIQAGMLELQLKRVNLADFAADAVESNHEYADQYNVKFVLDTLPDKAVYVDADEFRLLQVMNNLMSNAAKFSKPGDDVIIGIVPDERDVFVSVKDFGAGIPEEFQPHIFDQFSQADGSDTRKTQGTGLGLAISKTIIEELKGELWFETEIGKGTTFTFKLPIANS
jgi:signal transduction histidine kinase